VKALADNSFTVYLIHIPIIVFLQILLIGVTIDPLIKFAIVGAIGVPMAFAISHYGIRRLPYAKNILG
jgi:glucan biosynthesis protein C